MTPLNNSPLDDYEALIAALNKHKVKFVIVGAYAMAFHGYIRATEDIDILVCPDPTNAAQLVAALKDFNSVIVDPKEIKEKTMIELGRRPNALHLITTITGVRCDKAWKNRIQGKFGGQPASFLSKDCLIANKRATGRNKDTLDLMGLGVPPKPPKRKKL